MSTFALIALLLIAAWVAGSLVLRVGGLLTVLVSLAAGPASPTGLPVVIAGGIAWLTGHWLYALRHHYYRSPLARRLYLQALAPRLDPTRRWATPTTTAADPSRPSDDRDRRVHAHVLDIDHPAHPSTTRKDRSR